MAKKKKPMKSSSLVLRVVDRGDRAGTGCERRDVYLMTYEDVNGTAGPGVSNLLYMPGMLSPQAARLADWFREMGVDVVEVPFSGL